MRSDELLFQLEGRSRLLRSHPPPPTRTTRLLSPLQGNLPESWRHRPPPPLPSPTRPPIFLRNLFLACMLLFELTDSYFAFSRLLTYCSRYIHCWWSWPMLFAPHPNPPLSAFASLNDFLRLLCNAHFARSDSNHQFRFVFNLKIFPFPWGSSTLRSRLSKRPTVPQTRPAFCRNPVVLVHFCERPSNLLQYL